MQLLDVLQPLDSFHCIPLSNSCFPSPAGKKLNSNLFYLIKYPTSTIPAVSFVSIFQYPSGHIFFKLAFIDIQSHKMISSLLQLNTDIKEHSYFFPSHFNLQASFSWCLKISTENVLMDIEL